jgi:hypothetical protein
MGIVFVTPPPAKPSEPLISAAAAAQWLRRQGGEAHAIDASVGWHRFALSPRRLQATFDACCARGLPAQARMAFAAAVRAHDTAVPLLRRAETYRNRNVYTTAVNHLEQALALVAQPFAGLRLGVAMLALERPARRLESSAVLHELARLPGPFDAYFARELLPEIERLGASEVAVSLTFQQQAPAAFRLGRMLAERLPALRRVLGGPLIACWQAVGTRFDRPPFDAFDLVLAGSDEELLSFAGGAESGDTRTPGSTLRSEAPRSVGLDELPWGDYLAPLPVVPAALGRGCAWRRCTFCPDHLHPAHRACAPDELASWLRSVAARFPAGAMLHLTDSALPASHLAELAAIIAAERLPLRWHGFVRVQPELADPDFAHALARGGCALLQLGVESGSARLLELMGKGARPELSRRVLDVTAAAGIRNQIYLLFGLPTERDEDRELTLELVEAASSSIHAINAALLNLPRRSPMHAHAERFGITEIVPFGPDTDLSLYDDFRCDASHPRREARRWLAHRFFKSERVKAIQSRLRVPFKANHLCFLE